MTGGCPTEQAITALNVARDPQDPQVLLLGTQGRGLWRTGNGGATWAEVAASLLPGPNKPLVKGLLFDASVPGRVYALVDGSGSAGQRRPRRRLVAAGCRSRGIVC